MCLQSVSEECYKTDFKMLEKYPAVANQPQLGQDSSAAPNCISASTAIQDLCYGRVVILWLVICLRNY